MSAPPKKPSGFSLYGDLLNPSKGNTITGAPVKYEMKSTDAGQSDAQAVAQKKKDASLKFQPVIKRPQANAAGRGKGGKGFSSSGHKTSSSTVDGSGVASSPQLGQPQQNQSQQQRSKFSDWLGDEDDDYYFDHRQKGPRGGRKGKNKRKYKEEEQEVDWDAIYDPTKPTVLARYKGSTEQDAERREWKEYLYWHSSKNESRVDKRKPKNGMFAPPTGLNFAPPTGLNFAPPAFDEEKPVAHDPMDVDQEEEFSRPAFKSAQPSFAPPPPANVPDDPTGEDAYARRMRIGGMQPAQNAPPPPPPVQAFQPPAAASSQTPRIAAAQPASKPPLDKAEAQAKLEAAKAKIAAWKAAQAAKTPTAPSPNPPTQAVEPSPPPPPPSDPSTISRAPVRYNTAQPQPSPPTSQPAQNSRAPGKKDFGARMMAKMGWEKGQGLGASGEGITTALVAQTQKRKKRSDKDGGGWAQPRNMGKIVGGKKRPQPTSEADDNGAFGAMSPVVKLSGMLEGLDVAHEIEENNLLQEVGDEFGQKYGSIERLYVWREEQGGNGEVFVKFTSQLSALRAVNATDGMTFAGNEVVARFFDEERFERGEYA